MFAMPVYRRAVHTAHLLATVVCLLVVVVALVNGEANIVVLVLAPGRTFDGGRTTECNIAAEVRALPLYLAVALETCLTPVDVYCVRVVYTCFKYLREEAFVWHDEHVRSLMAA